MAKTFPQPKDPNDTAHYWYDFAPLLTKDVLLFGTPEVTVLNDADSITLTDAKIIGKRVYVTVANGTVGKSYKFEFVVQTSDGQSFNRVAILKVKDL